MTRQRGTSVFGILLLAAAAGGFAWQAPSGEALAKGPDGFHFPASGAATRDRAVLLAIDDVSLPLRHSLCLHLSKPNVRREPVLTPNPRQTSAPDNLATHFYGTVIEDRGKFRMWYYACHWGRNPDWPPEMQRQIAKTMAWAGDAQLYIGPLCYAESDDGLDWVKPALGQVLFKGSRENNALALPHTSVSCALVVKDDADPNPDRRYKMAYQAFPEQCDPPLPSLGDKPTLALAVSRDGIRWESLGVPFPGQFIEPSSFIRHGDQFILHYQVLGGVFANYYSEGGHNSGRTGVARLSYDFDHWVDGVASAFSLAEPADPKLRGAGGMYDQVHLGVGAASLGNVCVGLYGLWHNDPSFDKISCDFGLLVSNDGVRFHEPVKGYKYLDRDDSPAPTVPGVNSKTVLAQANGILNVGDETRIYHGRWRNVGQRAAKALDHYYAEIALATLPRDRWGALGLNPKTNEGFVWTTRVVLPAGGCAVSLNAAGSAGMRVEIADERFSLIPGFSGEAAGRTSGADGLDCPVKWNGRPLSELGGRTVRFRVFLERTEAAPDPRLFAVNLLR